MSFRQICNTWENFAQTAATFFPAGAMTRHKRRSSLHRLRLFALFATVGTFLCAMLLLAAWQYRGGLIHHYAKPYLEKRLSAELEAQVAIERLELEAGHLRVGGLVVERAGEFCLTALGLSLDFSLDHVRRGRLDGLRLFQPHLQLDIFALSQGDEALPAVWSKPPWGIGHLRIVDGRLDLALAEQRFAARAIALDMHGIPTGDFHLALELAAERPLALAAVGRLDWEDLPHVQVHELNVDGRALLATPLSLRPAPDGLAVGGAIGLARFDRAQLEPWLAIFGAAELLAPDLDFVARDLSLAVELAGGEVQGRLVAAELSLRLAERRVHMTNLSLKGAGDVRNWQGEGQLHWADEVPLFFQLQGNEKRIRAELQGELPEAARLHLLLGGTAALPLSGGLAGSARLEWRDGRLDVEGDFRGLPANSSIPEARADLAPLSGVFKAGGPLDGLTGDLRLDLAGRSFIRMQGGLDHLDAQLERTELSALAPLAAASLWPDMLERSGWIAGSIRVKLAQQDMAGALELVGEGWRALGFEWGATHISSRFRRQDTGLDLPDLRIQTALTGFGASLPRINVQGDVRWRPGGLAFELAHLHAREVEYLAADDMSAVAGGDVRLNGRLEWIAGRPLRVFVNGGVQVQEALVHSFYGDLSQLPLTLNLDAAWDFADAALAVTQIDLRLSDIGTLTGQGQWRQGALQAGGVLRLPQLEAGYNRQLRPLLATLFPVAEAFELGGALTLAGEGVFDPSGWRLAGTLQPEEFRLKRIDAQMELAQLRGVIPFSFAIPDEKSTPAAAQGWLAHEGLRFGPLSASPRRLGLRATTNRLTFADPWVLDLAGGRIHIDRLLLGWEPQGLYLAGRTRMDELDLSRLTRDFELPPMQGSLAADLGEFEYLGGYLQSQGEARLEVFGGIIQVRNIRAQDLFSSYRSFEGDIALQGLDLAQLTQTFEFGEINGILDGSIHDLRLFGAVPSAFVAEFATRARGQRNISVKAINNLAVISQGGISAALSRGVYRFIDFYRYRRMGLFCALRNDVFVLRGTARPGSDLYIVEGGLLPPRIDVLAPQSAISFREMLRRLSRIDRAGSR